MTGTPTFGGWGRALRAPVVATVLASAFMPASAFGHAVVQPGASRPADLQVYTITIPNESDIAFNRAELQVPAGIDFVLVEDQPGWKVKLTKKDDRVDVIEWSGGSIAPERYARFHLLARNPVEEGEIRWPILQHYADGSVSEWIGERDTDEPASFTDITETATPVDTTSVHGEKASTASGPKTADSKGSNPTGSDSTDELARWLAGGSLVVALLAFLGGLAVGRRRG